jgi:hypothetical protein
MYANMGRPLYKEDGGELNPGLQALQRTNPEVVDQILKREMGGPLYAQEGMPLTDTDTMKQMIMNSIRENPMLNSEGANSISPMGYNVRTAVSQLGNDVLGMDPSDKSTQEAANAAIAYQMSLR